MSEELVPRTGTWRREPQRGPVDLVSGMVRVAAGAWFKTAAWSLGATVRLVRSSGDPRAVSELGQDLVQEMRDLARELLGVSDLSLDARIRRLLPPAAAPVDARGENGVTDISALREQGTELLRQAADVNLDDDAHPAYARILLELAPDEARILRLLAADGPQPVVDVRTTQLIGGGNVVAERLNMVAAAAGVRYSDRVGTYLSNLTRLGLIEFSDEPLDDPITYQVLEAQPHVLEAVRHAARARTLQRSVRLTSFGQEFCKVCLPVEEGGL